METPTGFTDEELARVAQDSALGVATAVRKNFRQLKTKSGSRYFWHEAAAGTQVAEDVNGTTAYVEIRAKGVRLHWKGGTVRPGKNVSEVTGQKTKSLLIPFEDSPMRKRRVSLYELHYPQEKTHVLTSRNGCPVLVAAKERKKKTDLIFLGKLVKSATFTARPEVMPTQEALVSAAVKAGKRAAKEILKSKTKD